MKKKIIFFLPNNYHWIRKERMCLLVHTANKGFPLYREKEECIDTIPKDLFLASTQHVVYWRVLLS